MTGIRLLAAALALAFPVMVQAETARPASLDQADQADLKRIEDYLQGIHTLKASFDQTDPDGTVVSGELYMSRPGKMRFEYAPPSQLLIVSDGNYVGVDDLEMRQVTYYPVASTPVWFLLRESIRMSGDVTVTKFERGFDSLRVTAVQTNGPENGSITLVFGDHPLELVKWDVLDPSRQLTSIALSDPEEPATLDPALFDLPQNHHSTQPSTH